MELRAKFEKAIFEESFRFKELVVDATDYRIYMWQKGNLVLCLDEFLSFGTKWELNQVQFIGKSLSENKTIDWKVLFNSGLGGGYALDKDGCFHFSYHDTLHEEVMLKTTIETTKKMLSIFNLTTGSARFWDTTKLDFGVLTIN